MTRRRLLASLIVLASVLAFPSSARPAGKAGPLEVTYYYLPG
jgi:hypothetical protein